MVRKRAPNLRFIYLIYIDIFLDNTLKSQQKGQQFFRYRAIVIDTDSSQSELTTLPAERIASNSSSLHSRACFETRDASIACEGRP